MKKVNTVTLKRLVAHSRGLRLNRLLDKAVEKRLDPNGLHLLSQAIIHGDVDCIRCTVVLLKMSGTDEPFETVLDFSIDDFNRIPDHKLE